MATIKAARNFNARRDIETLHNAIDCLNTATHDEAVASLITLAVQRAWDQRGEIWNGYKKTYDEDLVDALTAKVGKGYFTDGYAALFVPAPDRDAKWFHSAMKGIGTDERLLIELTSTRTSRQLKAISVAYHKLYEKELADDVKGEVGGYLGSTLVTLLTVPRSESVASPERVSELAQKLYDGGKGKWGTDEALFIEILTGESRTTLKAVFSAYLSKFGQDILKVIDDEFSGQTEAGLKYLVKAVLSTAQVFADGIHEAVHGVGTDELALIRLVLARADIDLEDIKHAFEEKYKVPLAERLGKDEGGDFGKLLVAAVAPSS